MLALLGFAAILAWLLSYYGPEILTQAWNPYMPVLWWLLFVLAVWSVLCDDWALLPVVAHNRLGLGSGGYGLLLGAVYGLPHGVDLSFLTIVLAVSALVLLILASLVLVVIAAIRPTRRGRR